MKGRLRAKSAVAQINGLAKGNAPYFVVALQMQGDYQVQCNSRYHHLEDFITEVISSFAANAGGGACLVFKKHPLDNGLENWGKVIRRIAEKAGVARRVYFVDGGYLQHVLKKAKGTVVINSTVGLHALQMGCAVKTMGSAIYDMDGLTHQGSLDSFWTGPTPPEKENTAALVRLLAASIHVRGDFYSRKGRAVAVQEFSERLENDTVNGHGALVDPPPRLEKAKKAGISVEY